MSASNVRDETDSELIRRYAEGRDERAFAVLVRRHGGLVATVCGRMLRHKDDADDAFQAVFMVLARRASSIRHHASLAGWLHAVAVRVCLSEWRARSRRPQRGEVNVDDLPDDPGPTSRSELNEIRQVVDQELAGLPPKLRDVLVLCDIEGKSRPEAARLLQLSLSTATNRLKLARSTIRRRLAHRGFALSAAGVAAAVARGAEASLPMTPDLVSRTVRNANLFATGSAANSGTLGKLSLHLANSALYAALIAQFKLYAGIVAIVASVCVTGVVLASALRRLPAPVWSDSVLIDDFSDGSAVDESPARWASNDDSVIGVGAGGLVVRGRGIAKSVPLAIVAGVDGISLKMADMSIRTQVRLIKGGSIGIAARLNNANWDIANGYYAVIYDNMTAEIGVSGLALAKGTRTISLNPKREDVVMQLDVIGGTVSMWVWRPGEPMPVKPLLTFQDASVTAGNPAVFAISKEYPALGDAEGVFRYVHVAASSIPRAFSGP